MEAYLDNSATTPLCVRARERMVEAIEQGWGNPSSLHRPGIQASEALKYARQLVAKRLFCDEEEVIFTGSGTLSDNAAIFGAAHALKRRGKRIITTEIEHPAVDEPFKQLEKEGFEVIRLKVDAQGKINVRDLTSAVNQDTVLVSIMSVNNEVGSIQPVEAVRAAVNRANSPALIHCDAVQAFGKLPMRPSSLGVDLLSFSGHKINGPKGVGVLYIKKGVRIEPYIFGGYQEGGIYSGTQPMPAIMGLAGALEEMPDPAEQLKRVGALRNYFVNEAVRLGGVVINSPPDALPYIVNLSVLGINSEPMMNLLSSRGVYISSGSACAKGHKSRVLTAMKLGDERIASALRISLSRFTVREELDMLLYGLEICKKTIKQRNK